MSEQERLVLPARLESLQEFRLFVRRAAERASLAPEDMDRLDLVVEELFVNIARYAYTPACGDVELVCRTQPGALMIDILDSGREFNPLATDPPDFSRGLAERPLGGLGLFLVKSIAQSIRYERDGGSNRLSFVFSGSVRQSTAVDSF